jgi:probable HAF family extracellular repeat protein
VSQLHTSGYGETGVYGSPTNAQTDFWNASTAPENVWVAKTGTNSLTAPTATIWGLSPLVDGRWAVNSRIRQYLGNHTVKWGSLSVAIDHDIEDAPVVSGIWSKTHTFSFTSFDCGVATFPNAMEGVTSTGQIGEVVGYYEDAGGSYHGFSYSGGPWTSIDYSGAMRTLATGINSAGQIVGMYMDQSCLWHGFLNGGAAINYPGALNTYATGINDDSQVIGYYEDTAGNFHGFLQNAGKFYSFDYVGAVGLTTARGINGIAQVVGWYWPSSTGSPQGYTSQMFTSQVTPPVWTAGSFAPVTYPGSSIVYAMSNE